MVKQHFSRGLGRFRRTPTSIRSRQRYRRARIEFLEPRLALTAPTFLPLPDTVTLLAGTSLHLALNGTDSALQPGDPPPFYSFDVVGVSNVQLTNPNVQNPQLQAQILDPAADRSVKMTVSDAQDQISGDMILQFFEDLAPRTTSRIMSLIDATGSPMTPPTYGGPFYDGLTFHRVIKDFMVQGGDPLGDGTGGSGVKFDDEFNAKLQFTSSGILAMANSGADTNDSQFFITTNNTNPYRSGDFKYTIFGFLTKGYDVLHKIESVPTGANDKPVNNVIIESVTPFVDGENRALRLWVPDGTTGTADVKVEIYGDPHYMGVGDPPAPVTHTFHVTILPDTVNDNPFIGGSIATVQTTANTTSPAFQIPATDVEGDAIYYDGGVYPTNANLTFTTDHNTGQTTVQATNGWAGVGSVVAAVRAASGQTWDTQDVPVYVNPAKPTVELLASSDTGPSNSDRITNPELFTDSTQGTLGFRLSGLVSGAEAVLFADGTEIARGTASSDSLILRNATTFAWTAGSHAITARQTLRNQTVAVGNTHTTVDLDSGLTSPLGVTVDSTAPQITSTAPLTATRGAMYAYDVQSTEEPGVQYQLTAGPAGMQIDSQTGAITWIPGAGQIGTAAVTVHASDPAGNTAQQSFQIEVHNQNLAPVADPQTLRVLSDTPKAIVLTGNDSNIELVQTMTYALGDLPTHGTLSGFDSATGAVTYTPEAGYTGSDHFTFTVTDDDTAGPPGPLTSAAATVSIQVVPVNHPPTANPQSVTTDEHLPVTITLTGDDGDPNLQQTLSFLIVGPPSHGTLSVLDANAGTMRYTPGPDYNGQDSFTFRTMDDAQGDPSFLTSDPAEVSITINAIDDPPVARTVIVSIQEGSLWAEHLPGNDGDPLPNEVQPLEFTITIGPSHGAVTSLDSSTGAITYVPAQDFNGSDAITFTVKELDTERVSPPGTVSIVITSVNKPPIATGQQVTTAEDTTLRIALGSDGDPEVQQVLQLNVVTAPAHGTLSGFNSTTGEVTYVPGADFSGSDSFTYTLTDDARAGQPARLTSGQATVAINVTPVDDPPRFLPVQPGLATPGQEFRVTIRSFDVDVPPDPIRYSLEPGAPAGATIDPVSGQITWPVPADTPPGTVRLTVRATEVTPAALSATQTIEVGVVNIAGALAQASASRTQPVIALAAPNLAGLSDLTAPAVSLPILGPQTTFGLSNLLGSPSFLSSSFGLSPGGGGTYRLVEAPAKKPVPTTPPEQKSSEGDSGQNATSESGDRKLNEAGNDRTLRQGQSRATMPEASDAAFEDLVEGEDWLALAAEEAELLLAAAE